MCFIIVQKLQIFISYALLILSTFHYSIVKAGVMEISIRTTIKAPSLRKWYVVAHCLDRRHADPGSLVVINSIGCVNCAPPLTKWNVVTNCL